MKENRGRKRMPFLFMPCIFWATAGIWLKRLLSRNCSQQGRYKCKSTKIQTALRSRPYEWWPLSLRRTYGRKSHFVWEAKRAPEGCSIQTNPVLLKSGWRIFWVWYPWTNIYILILKHLFNKCWLIKYYKPRGFNRVHGEIKSLPRRAYILVKGSRWQKKKKNSYICNISRSKDC